MWSKSNFNMLKSISLRAAFTSIQQPLPSPQLRRFSSALASSTSLADTATFSRTQQTQSSPPPRSRHRLLLDLGSTTFLSWPTRFFAPATQPSPPSSRPQCLRRVCPHCPSAAAATDLISLGRPTARPFPLPTLPPCR